MKRFFVRLGYIADTMRKVLIVVDMQNDFVSGALGTAEAQAIVPSVLQKAGTFSGEILFTRDTHDTDYLKTQEGRNLPVQHCIKDSEGWQIIPELRERTEKSRVFDKPTFGSVELMEYLRAENAKVKIDEMILVGLCTDICVISNAMLLKAGLPEIKITVDASCCAGVTPERHANALDAMRACQIDVT